MFVWSHFFIKHHIYFGILDLNHRIYSVSFIHNLGHGVICVLQVIVYLHSPIIGLGGVLAVVLLA